MAKVEFQIDKADFEKIIKGCYKQSALAEGNSMPLAYVQVKYSPKTKDLKFITTDGNKMIVKTINNLDVLIDSKTNIIMLLDLPTLAKIKFVKSRKSVIDLLQIELNQNGMKINDVMNNFQYSIKKIDLKYPDINKVIAPLEKNKKKIDIMLNATYLKSILESISQKAYRNYITLSISTKDNLTPICIKNEDDSSNIKDFAILMPMKKG